MAVEAILKDLWVKIMAKMMLHGRNLTPDELMSQVVVLSLVFSQNRTMLEKYEKDLNYLVALAMNLQVKARRKMPEDMVGFLVKDKIMKNISFKM